MGVLTPAPSPSALQTLLALHQPNTAHRDDNARALNRLARQIAHNLAFQHRWTDVRIHNSASPSSSSSSSLPLPRPVLSGLPPHRLYVHPDEQIALLQHQKDVGGTGMPHLEPEREWVLPSHLREKWSLRRFGEVFDGLAKVPGRDAGEGVRFGEGVDGGDGVERGEEDGEGEVVEDDAGEGGDDVRPEHEENEWRAAHPKRLLLAVLDDDSTIVYYIVHDGIVKPRQN